MNNSVSGQDIQRKL